MYGIFASDGPLFGRFAHVALVFLPSNWQSNVGVFSDSFSSSQQFIGIYRFGG